MRKLPASAVDFERVQTAFCGSNWHNRSWPDCYDAKVYVTLVFWNSATNAFISLHPPLWMGKVFQYPSHFYVLEVCLYLFCALSRHRASWHILFYQPKSFSSAMFYKKLKQFDNFLVKKKDSLIDYLNLLRVNFDSFLNIPKFMR